MVAEQDQFSCTFCSLDFGYFVILGLLHGELPSWSTYGWTLTRETESGGQLVPLRPKTYDTARLQRTLKLNIIGKLAEPSPSWFIDQKSDLSNPACTYAACSACSATSYARNSFERG